MNAALPMYAQLKETIISSIVRGELKPGNQLPSQRSLCERYDMSHMTVRRALAELTSEGVIYAIPGKGIYVSAHKEYAESEPLIGFTEDMARRGMVASSRILDAQVIGTSTVLAKVLGVPVGTSLVFLRRLRLANGEPIALQTSYLPHALCPGLLQHDLAQGSLFAILRQVYGLRLTHGATTVEAALADEEDVELFGVTLPAALLVTEQITYLDNGVAIEFVRTTYRGDRYRMGLR